MNLVGNALKFTAEGEVVVKVHQEEQSDKHLVLRFSIIDTGIGLSQDGCRRLFQPFSQEDSSTTRKYGGTGLGLSISKKLTELMGGNIGVNSELGQGSCFWFTTRLGIQSQPTSVNSLPATQLKRARICLIDNNEANRTLLRNYTNHWSMESVEANNASAALALLRNDVEKGESYDIAIIDREMPEIDGMDLGKTLKADPQLASIKLVLMNPMVNRADSETIRRIGFSAHLTKPIRYHQLQQCLLNVMRRSEVSPVNKPQLEFEATVTGPALRLLLADDNLVNQKVAVRMLEKLGYQVDIAPNGREAVEAATHYSYSAILMDCLMPEMDGFEATCQIKKLQGSSSPPIIAMTANTMQGDREKCLAAGMDAFLSKPVKVEELKAILEKWIPQDSCAISMVKTEKGTQTDSEASVPELVTEVPTIHPPLNSATLQDLRHLGGENDPDFFVTVIEQFLQDSTTHLTDLQEAIEEGNGNSLQQVAHAFKGSARIIGAQYLSKIALQLEQIGESGNLTEAKVNFSELQTEYHRVRDALQSALAHPTLSTSKYESTESLTTSP